MRRDREVMFGIRRKRNPDERSEIRAALTMIPGMSLRSSGLRAGSPDQAGRRPVTGNLDRESHHVIARSEATRQSILSLRREMDCFASLAMTVQLLPPHLVR